MHSGAIKEHLNDEHLTNLTMRMMKAQTTALDSCRNLTKLHTFETLHILHRGLSMNHQANS